MGIVSRETFDAFIATVRLSKTIAVDTETTGLFPYRGDSLFSIIFATHAGQWYLNFKKYENCSDSLVLGEEHILLLQEIFNDEKKRFFFHNAKFDLAFLSKLGIECRGTVHDTRSVYRIINNEAFLKWSLDNCAKAALGVTKSDMVELFIAENELWEWTEIPGKKTRQKNKFFHQVPLDIISNYGLKDGEITYALGAWQLEQLKSLEMQSRNLNIRGYVDLYRNETALTKTVFEMERRGVLIDRGYVNHCIDLLKKQMQEVEAEFSCITGKEYKESPKVFEEIFKDETLCYGERTATGKRNPSFDSRVLEGFKGPAARLVLTHRSLKSKLDFFQGFLFFAGSDDVLHTSFNQDGTVTGRFSSSNPNLQNLEKSEGESLRDEIVVRRAIVPRPGFFFACFDFDQMEYRLMLDLAGAKGLISKVLGGLDVHQATADLAKITRKQAKTVNFGVLYGQGTSALSASLGVSQEEAERIKRAIFDASPEIEELIESQKYLADQRGYVVNWLGRRCYFPLVQTQYGKKRMVHKAVNSIIQGGCADVVKIAMNRLAKLLEDKSSKLVLQIHDELCFEMHESEAYLLPQIKQIMESVYPYKSLPLTVGCDYSFKSLADKIEGYPPGTEARNSISNPHSPVLECSP